MTSEKISVEIIGLSSKAKGGFRVAAETFCTFLPQNGIDARIYGYTEGNPRGSGKYIPILTRLYPNKHLIYLGLFLIAPFLPIRKKAIIMANMEHELVPFILFYPRHPKIIRVTGPAQSIELNTSKLTSWLYYRLEWLAFRFADKLLVLDQASEKYLREKYHIPESKVRFLPMGVNIDKFKPLDKQQAREKMGLVQGRTTILYVGRLIKSKNIELLLDSFAEVKKQRQDVLLLLAGTGESERELRQYVQQHRIPDVTFLRHVDHDDMPILMNCADVFAFPSLIEGEPRVIKEALACGLPVVSTPVGDITEYVKEGENGFIAKTEVSDFTSGLLRALDNKERLIEGAIKRREELSTEKAMKIYAKVFRELYEQKYRKGN